MISRSSRPELLDDLNMPGEALHASLGFMSFVNAFFGGTRAVIDYFESHETPGRFTVLDIGSGGGDIPSALARWAAKKKKEIHVTAIDLNPRCVEYAEARFGSPRVRFLRHSAFDIESLGRFDYVISSMFFHHLSDDAIVDLFRRISLQSRRGFLVNDLYRNRLNKAGAGLFGALSLKRVVYHDATLSVDRAFREEDFARYRDAAGVPFRIERRPVFRITASHHAQRPD